METDWKSIEDETLRHLQALIRFNTVNPPGNEIACAEYIATTLKADGIESEILLSAPMRANIIARLKGTGPERPVMMMAHMDVVGVEPDKWSCDPFAGVVRDGFLYGRGAIDDKGMLAANLMAMILVKRLIVDRGIALERDVIFLATADEETGGDFGIKWLMANHPEKIDAEFAINEGGRVRLIADGKRYIAIQTCEKISHMVTITARGPAGHSSVPQKTNAVFRLGRALAKLADYQEPLSLTQTTMGFFEALSRIWPDEDQGKAMALMRSTDPKEFARGEKILSAIPVFNAVMRNGISPTKLSGGFAGNVIPAEVSAVMNVRTLPENSIEAAVARMSEFVGDDGIEFEITSHGEDAPASDPTSAMFKAIESAAKSLDPELAVAPYLSTGGTDSSTLRRNGIDAYGVLPFPMEQPDEGRMHGHDERVPVKSLHFGTKLVYESIKRIASAS